MSTPSAADSRPSIDGGSAREPRVVSTEKKKPSLDEYADVAARAYREVRAAMAGYGPPSEDAVCRIAIEVFRQYCARL